MGLRRGFWRLTLVFWLLGIVVILALFAQIAGVNPFANLCTPPGAEYVTACLGETVSSAPKGSFYDETMAESDAERAVRDAERNAKANGTTVEQELKKEGRNVEGRKFAVDPNKVVPRWTADYYRSHLRLALAGLAGWIALTWGLFYLIAWVARGFTGPPSPRS